MNLRPISRRRRALSVTATQLLLILGCLGAAGLIAGEPAARWSFDTATNLPGQLRGFSDFIPGVRGQCLRFDGFTTSLVQTNAIGALKEYPRTGFTLQAWVALGAYPWNWVPILQQGDYGKSGFYFGIDANGRFGLQMRLGEEWITCRSEIRPDLQQACGPKVDLELRTWYHLAAVFEPGKAITIYRNGVAVSSVPLQPEQKAVAATAGSVYIGMPREPMPASHPVRSWATFATPYSLDGAIDEIAIHDRPLSGEEIAAGCREIKPEHEPALSTRDWPTIPPNRGNRFGAFATTLKYYPQWDRLWERQATEHADVVVTFDTMPIKVVFWRGTRYSPCWVSENNKWMADQSREVGGNWGGKRPWQDEPTGCVEHMQDTQCRSSRVQIIESTPARVVVEWVYAQMDALCRYKPDRQGWPLWGRERYTIYPDGAGVRHVLPGEGGWQETIFLNAAGTRPEDNVEAEAMTLVTLDGKTDTYSWAAGYPSFKRNDAPIQVINFKSKFKPFLIFMPGSRIACFDVERRPEYSIFPWWNHWPVAMIASDGRNCQAADRASHSSLAWGSPRGDCALYGMTDQPPQSLVAVAKAWSSPPPIGELSDPGGSVKERGYVPQQRAYVLGLKGSPTAPIGLRLDASAESPLHHPAFVLKGWGESSAAVTIDGKAIVPGKELRVGHVPTLEGTDLVVWVNREATQPVTIRLERETPKQRE